MTSEGPSTSTEHEPRAVLTVETLEHVNEDVAERSMRQLRRELRDEGVGLVEFAPGDEAPAGSKGADPDSLITLLVTLSASGGVLTTLLGTVQAWLNRQREARRVSIKLGEDHIELEMSSDRQDEIVRAFLERNAGR